MDAYGNYSGFGNFETRDVRAVGTLARTSRFGAWELRVAGGVGVVRTSVNGFVASRTTGYFNEEGVFPTAEVSVQLSRRIGRHWAIAAGPVVSWYDQQFDALVIDEASLGGPTPMPMPIDRTDAELRLFAGLRHEI